MSKWQIGERFDKDFETPALNIVEVLKAQAYDIEQDVRYTRDLTDEQLAQRRERLAEISIELSEIADEKKEANAEFKERMKPLALGLKEMQDACKFKAESIRGNKYMVDDQGDGLMYEFGDDGTCVNIRPLTRTERQLKIQQAYAG